MINQEIIETLEHWGILGDIRYRLGIEETDISMDEKISRMSPQKIVALWVGFELGDENWAHAIINKYEILKDKQL